MIPSRPDRPSPYLSVVAASRNDDHGGDPLIRTQIFINCFARQCEKYRLPAELILVDWNPVVGRPGLAGVLQLPTEATYCSARVITVPAVLHDRFKYGDRLAFFQMIAKNAGIRRARGQFILATNIDIIFSDELMRHISEQRLDPAKMLRVDRYDIHRDIPLNFSVDETLAYAWTHPVRSNRRLGPTALVKHLYGDDPFKRQCQPGPEADKLIEGLGVVAERGVWSVRPRRDTVIDDLHTNACGDFTLLSKEGWETIRGYAEFASYSFNIDSLGLASAHYGGFEEVALLPPCVCFHIEHSLGSGWTPEGEQKLFARLQEKKILNPEWEVVLPVMEAMRHGELPVALNGPSWGLASFDLPEDPLWPGRIVAGPVHPRDYRAPVELPVSALPPEFDLDLLTVWQKRISERLTKKLKASQTALKRAEGYLKEVEQDRDNRLVAIVEAQNATKRTIEYFQQVEKDSADRLATIHFYQDKLKTAYADLERNVAYLKTLEAEIAAHVKVSAEKDVIIASLNEQLRAATESRPAGS